MNLKQKIKLKVKDLPEYVFEKENFSRNGYVKKKQVIKLIERMK